MLKFFRIAFPICLVVAVGDFFLVEAAYDGLRNPLDLSFGEELSLWVTHILFYGSALIGVLSLLLGLYWPRC